MVGSSTEASSHVYLGLRRHYPGVHVDYLDVAAQLGKILGEAPMYQALWPELHRSAHSLQIGDPAALNSHHGDIYELPRGHARPRDMRAHGAIRLTACVGHQRCTNKTVAHWEKRCATARRRGTTRYAAPLAVTLPSGVLIHEYGQLLDAAIWSHSHDLAEAVYAELSRELLGDRDGALPNPNQWTRHLINYPAGSLPVGPATGAGKRIRRIRRALRPVLGERLGRYALVTREELFAETFMYALGGRDRTLRNTWVHRIRPLPAEAGIATRR